MPAFHPIARAARLSLGLLLLGAAAAPVASAAPAPLPITLTWNGRGPDNGVNDRDPISGLTNWGSALPPADLATHYVFDGLLRLRPVIDMNGFTAASLSFAAGAGSFDIGGSMIFSHGDISNHSLRRQTLSSQLSVQATQTWTGGPGGLLVQGEFFHNGGTLTLAKGAMLASDDVALRNGTLRVLAGATLNLSGVDDFTVTLGTNAAHYNLDVVGEGAGAGISLPTWTRLQRGKLSVREGAQLKVERHLQIGRGGASSVNAGELDVQGAGSLLEVGGLFHFGGDTASQGRVHGSGTLHTSTASLAAGINVGDGKGSFLRIEDDGYWRSNTLSLGTLARRTEARVELANGGRLWLLSSLLVGEQARSDDASAVSGRVRVEAGGLLDATQASVQLGGAGGGRLELQAGGEARIASLQLGSEAGGSGQFWLSGAGSFAEVARTLNAVRGRIEVLDGARLRAEAMTLGAEASLRAADASLTAKALHGQGASLLLQGGASLRVEDQLFWTGGSLQLDAGATLNTRNPVARWVGRVDAEVGGALPAHAWIQGGQWQSDELRVAGSAPASLLISAGGGLQAHVLMLGGSEGRGGLLTLADGSAALGQLRVGDAGGVGELRIGAGGQLTSGESLLGGAGSRAEVQAGGHWQAARLQAGVGSTLQVAGRFDTQQLDLAGDAQLQAGSGGRIETLVLQGGRLQREAGATAIGSLVGAGQVEGDLQLDALSVQSGQALVLAARQAQDGLQVAGVAVSGSVLSLSYAQVVRLGALSLARAELHATGTVEVDRLSVLSDSLLDAPLHLLGNVGLSNAHLALHGDVHGAGQFDNHGGRQRGSLSFHAGYAPEAATTLFKQDRVRFADSAQLTLDLAGPEAFERLHISGVLQAGGTLRLAFADATAWAGGATLDLLDFGSWEGGFAAFQVTGLDATRLDFSRLGLDGTVHISAVPEPTPALLLAIGLAAFALRRLGSAGAATVG